MVAVDPLHERVVMAELKLNVATSLQVVAPHTTRGSGICFASAWSRTLSRMAAPRSGTARSAMRDLVMVVSFRSNGLPAASSAVRQSPLRGRRRGKRNPTQSSMVACSLRRRPALWYPLGPRNGGLHATLLVRGLAGFGVRRG